MPFTVGDLQDLIRLLREKPEWAEEVRRVVLTEELLGLPELVRELASKVRALAEAQLRAEERLAGVEERLAGVEERLAGVEERLARIEEAHLRTEEELRALVRQFRHMRETQDRFAQIIGPTVEGRMAAAVIQWLAERGHRLLEPLASVPLDGVGDIDGLARVALREGGEAWLLVSAKAKVWPRDVSAFAELLRNPAAREALRGQGVAGPVLPLIFAMVMDHRSPAAAASERVGLVLEAQGEIVPPARWAV